MLYRELVPIFETSILTTYKAKFVQYCIFLVCGLEAEAAKGKTDASTITGTDGGVHDFNDPHPLLYRSFAAKLIDIFVDPYRATLTRRSGACYLASFISRSSYISTETVCESISALLRWAETYMYSLGSNAIRATDAIEQADYHSLFYTVCQAAFYIMCFRGVEAIDYYLSAVDYHSTTSSSTPTPPEDENLWELPHPDNIDICGQRWMSLCCHELQPLRFCLESVRDEFLHVAHAFDLIEKETLERLNTESKRMSSGKKKRKKKASLIISTAATLEKQRQQGGVGGLGVGSNPLKTFFPFDPLLLCRSHEFVQPFYKNWNGPIEEQTSSSDDEEDGIVEEKAEEADQMMQHVGVGVDAKNEQDQNSIVNHVDSSDDEEDHDSATDASSSYRSSFSYAQPMSLASTYGDHMTLGTPVASTAGTIQDGWQEAIERPRSYSIASNGSW